MVKFVLVFSHLSGFAGKYIGIDPETIKNAAHKSAITKDFYIRDAKIPVNTPTTGIPRFVRTSNSALSISAQKQILTTPRFVRIINSISAHVSQLRCCNFDVV